MIRRVPLEGRAAEPLPIACRLKSSALPGEQPARHVSWRGRFRGLLVVRALVGSWRCIGAAVVRARGGRTGPRILQTRTGRQRQYLPVHHQGARGAAPRGLSVRHRVDVRTRAMTYRRPRPGPLTWASTSDKRAGGSGLIRTSGFAGGEFLLPGGRPAARGGVHPRGNDIRGEWGARGLFVLVDDSRARPPVRFSERACARLTAPGPRPIGLVISTPLPPAAGRPAAGRRQERPDGRPRRERSERPLNQ